MTQDSRDRPPRLVPLLSRPPAGVVMHDSNGRVVVASEQAATLLHCDGPEALVGRKALFDRDAAIREDGTTLAPDDEPAAIALRTGEIVDALRIGWVQSDASVRWFEVEARPLFAVGATTPYAAVCRFVDVPQSRKATVLAPTCYANLRSRRGRAR